MAGSGDRASDHGMKIQDQTPVTIALVQIHSPVFIMLIKDVASLMLFDAETGMN
jgi:hypothetical protein